MSATTLALHARLWRMYGDERHPAEWDGRVYGGGKISQRFWEYLKTIEALDLRDDSVVLDIGGGSPKTGVSLFVKVLAGGVARVIVVDPALPSGAADDPRMVFVAAPASYERLMTVFAAYPDITHVSSVSVLEHIPPTARFEIMRAINDGFRGDTFVLTLEFHETTRYFDDQLTTASLSELAACLTRFVPVSIEASPIQAMNAFLSRTSLYTRLRARLRLGVRSEPLPVGLWKPLMVKFVRCPDSAGSRDA